jgi:FtsH-binding integral membrane protein
MSRWRPFVLVTAAGLNIVAVVVSIWWGPVIVVLPFMACWAVGAALALWARRKRSVLWVTGALVATLFGAFEPVGGILASFVQHERPGIGPLLAATTAAGSLIALSGVATSDWRRLERASRSTST